MKLFLNFSKILTILSASLLVCSLVEGVDRCKSLSYLTCEKNKKFTGHVIKRLHVPNVRSLEECQNRCFNEDKCLSMNLSPIGHSTLCELNSLDHVTHPKNVINQPGSDYCPIKNMCKDAVCSQGTLCSPDFYLETHKCLEKTWGQWGPWNNACSTKTRTRKCQTEHHQLDSQECSGSSIEMKNVMKSCGEYVACGQRASGIRAISPDNGQEIKVRCDQDKNGGGWAIILRRFNGSQDFYLAWQSYRDGFGDLDGEYWLGLENIHRITGQQKHRLMIAMEDKYYAEYDYFAVGSEADNYILRLGSYSGNISDSFTYHRGSQFSTKDRDNDASPSSSCAESCKGAWWYNSCQQSNLNGVYGSGAYCQGLSWMNPWGHYHSVSKVVMKIRPVN